MLDFRDRGAVPFSGGGGQEQLRAERNVDATGDVFNLDRRMKMKRLLRGSLAILVTLGIGLVASAPAQAVRLGSRPNWGACGVSTSESRMVYDFGSLELKCGNASWGYRHIKSRHYDEFQTLARAGGLNWSDLVHWAIYYNTIDPDHVVVDQNTGCRDRLLYLHDRNGRLVWQKRFRLIYNSVDGRVITVYPGGVCT